MSKCLKCGKECKQTPGRRARVFCDGICRSTYWQKERSKQKRLLEGKKKIPVKNSVKKESKEEEMTLMIKNGKQFLVPSSDISPDIMQENVPRETDEVVKYDFTGFKFEKTIMPIAPTTDFTIDANRINIHLEIGAIKNELIPPERDTILGRKVWKAEQNMRIKELEDLLK